MVKEPLDSETVRKALEALTESYHKTSVENGLGGLLRGDLRMEMLKQKQEEDKLFVKALSQVKEAFTQVENNVVRLDEDCDELRRRINTAQQATAGIASQAGLLSEEKEELIVREKLANMFATRFSLTEREMEILGSDTLDDEYFLALDRVAEARSDCQKLLSVKKQTAADDLLLELTQQEEYAFNTLLRWVQSNIRTLNRKHSFKMLGKALSRLQPHQALFDVAMAEFGRVRADIVGSAFLIALVRGGEGGIPRPIETHAADPLRYVGDMLAWLHQTCASEKELLEMMEIGTGLVSDTLAGVARPLEIRIRQTLAAINDPI
ncbi:Golgi transport complex subunit 6, partial [Coemansia sp. RSA 1365]